MRLHSSMEVNLGILKENFHRLKAIAKNKTIFMIKADAYGHGLLSVANYVHQEGLCDSFGVASLGEAIEIRKKLPSLKKEIYVFSDIGLAFSETAELYSDYGVVPVIASMEDLKVFLERKEFKNFPLTLKVDTGMNRLGISPAEAALVAQMLRRHHKKSVNHLMTHFASSYVPKKDNDKTSRQYQNFLKFKADLRSNGISVEESSCANSGAIEQGIGLEESHIRPGLMLYGPSSVGENGSWSGEIVSSLRTHIIKTLQVKKGTPIGYGSHVSHMDGLLSYIPLGYGDGILTSYSKATLSINGWKAKILGRVNMDLTALLFEPEAKFDITRGTEVALWDRNSESVSSLSVQTGTIPYQIFTGVTSRVPRRYFL